MGDGTEVVVRSDREEKIKLGEDEEVAKNELVGSDETRDENEDEVFEEAVASENDEQEVQKRESFEPEDSSLKDSKDEHEVDDFEEAVGDLDETSSNEEVVKDLKVDHSVVGECHGVGEAEFDVVTPKVNGDRGKVGEENSYGQIESSLHVVENTEKANTNGSSLEVEDVSIENGKT